MTGQALRGSTREAFVTKWPHGVALEDELPCIHAGFNVVTITKFRPEDVGDFLGKEVPLEKCHAIVVRDHGTQIKLPTSTFRWVDAAKGK